MEISKCLRCQQPLGPRSGFCAACGHDNGNRLTTQKVLQVDRDLERRRRGRGIWRMICDTFFASRR